MKPQIPLFEAWIVISPERFSAAPFMNNYSVKDVRDRRINKVGIGTILDSNSCLALLGLRSADYLDVRNATV